MTVKLVHSQEPPLRICAACKWYYASSSRLGKFPDLCLHPSFARIDIVDGRERHPMADEARHSGSMCGRSAKLFEQKPARRSWWRFW